MGDDFEFFFNNLYIGWLEVFSMNLGLHHKKVIVTGAANGIGAAVFNALLREGAVPIGIDLEPFHDSELEKIIFPYNLEEFEGAYFFHQSDATNYSEMEKVLSPYNDLYGLVNNIGLLGNDSAHGGRSVESWNKVMNANATSAFILTELSYPKMQAGSSIVNIGSIELDMAAPDVVLYTASKGALLGLTVSYSTTLAPNIRVNMVSPGNVNTERNKAQYTEARSVIDSFEGRTPLKRSVEPQEVADLVMFLLSEKSGAITGQNYRIDGGYTRALWDPSWNIK